MSVHDDPQQYIRDRVFIDDAGCWLWTLSTGSLGYGQVSRWVDGRTTTTTAHRYAYLAFVGPVPEGQELDHLCRVRRCCNPAHVEPVTHTVNMGRGERAQRTHCDHGHEYTPENTKRNSVSGHRYCRECDLIRKRARRRCRP